MRKLTLIFHGVIAIVVTLLCSCQKNISEKFSPNSEVINKINTWLDNQKLGIKQFKAENIDLLKKNFDYSNLRIEKSDRNEQIVIIPIAENFKQMKINDKNCIPNLVILLNSSGDVRWGSVILFKPETPGSYKKVPDNVFHDLFNTGVVKCDGQFQFLSPAGHWEFQLNFKNGSFNSCGQIQSKADSNSVARTSTICINWYLVTSYYVDGVLVNQTSEYVGTTCSEQCGDGSYASLCPDGSGSGGGSTNDLETSDQTSETVEVDDETDDYAGVAPKIRFQYDATVFRTNGSVTGVYVVPTYVNNPNPEYYVDRYGRNTTRYLTLYGFVPNWTSLGTNALVSWMTFVMGRWYYTDGSDPYTRVWVDTHSSLR